MKMKEITKEYAYLFNEISGIIIELELLRAKLIACQQRAEEIYIGDSAE